MLSSKTLALLGLYFVQGLPFGFQVNALPVFLRAKRGASLSAIAGLQLLSLPWMLKPLAAPMIDATGTNASARLRWIVPLQLGLAASSALAAFVDAQAHVAPLLFCVFLMNLFAAAQDIATDGYAIDLLKSQQELGTGNTAQVVGYKVGMLFGGGLLVWLSSAVDWSGLFLIIAALVVAVLLGVLALHRTVIAGQTASNSNSSASASATAAAAQKSQRTPIATILKALWSAMRATESKWTLVLLASYKLGEALIDTMFKPLLVDQGFAAAQIGRWNGVYGMVASILGSIAGGRLAADYPLLSGLRLSLIARVLPLFLKWMCTFSDQASESLVVTSIVGESFFGGMLTTVVFTWMMAMVDPRIGASHFTLLAALEVIGKSLAGLLSGVLAETLGYSTSFAIGVAQSAALPLLLVPISAAAEAASRTQKD